MATVKNTATSSASSAAMNAGNSNQPANADQIIRDVMSNAVEDGKRQARLVRYMFDDAANYGSAFIKSYHAVKAAEKVAFIDDVLRKMSPEYDRVYKKWMDAKDKDNSKETKEARGAIVEGCLVKMRPAREMLKRSITSLQYLRDPSANVKKFVVRSDGRLQVTTLNKENEEEHNNLSGRELTLLGQALKPATPRSATAGAGASRSTGMALKSAMEFAANTLKSDTFKGKGLDDLGGDELSAAANSLLVTLLLKQFAHDGKVRTQELAEWIRDAAAGIEVDGKVKPAMTAAEAEASKAKDAVPPATPKAAAPKTATTAAKKTARR